MVNEEDGRKRPWSSVQHQRDHYREAMQPGAILSSGFLKAHGASGFRGERESWLLICYEQGGTLEIAW
jgi:hypothetical protein